MKELLQMIMVEFIFRYSHAYFANAIQMPSVPWGVPLHCDLRPLKTPTGIIRILLVVCIGLFLCFCLFFALSHPFVLSPFLWCLIKYANTKKNKWCYLLIYRYRQPHVLYANFQLVLFKSVYSSYH